MNYKKLLLASFLIILVSPSTTLARTTPEDIYNEKLSSYTQKANTYSPENKQKLENLNKRLHDLNLRRTTELSALMERQSEILDEYIRRNNIKERQADGITRNLSDPIENARYQITYAHEAVAYQAAKRYIYTLSSESNISNDTTNLVAIFKSELESTRNKVIASQKVLERLISQ